MALAETAELAVRISLKDNVSAGVRRLQGNLGGLSKSIGQVGKGFGQIGAGVARAGLLVGGAAITGITAAAKASIDFEDAFAGVRKTVDETDLRAAGLDFEQLAKQFRTMATEIPIAATEFARIGEAAGALGVSAGDIDDFTKTVALLGVTTNLTTDEAAESLGKIGTILNLTGGEFENFADILVNLGNKGASTEGEIIEITKRFAAAGKQAHLTIPEILGFASAIASAGAEPEAAGSSLSRLFSNLIQETALATDKGKAFAKISGKSFKDFSKIVKTDTVDAMLTFLDQLRKLDTFEASKALKAVGITNVRDRNAILLLAQTYESNLIPALRNAQDSTGALSAEATKRFDTLRSKLQLLRNNLIEAAITFGDGLTPAIGRATEKLIAFLRLDANKSRLKELGEDIGKSIDAINWDAVLTAADQFVGILKGALSFAKLLYDAFSALPGPIKEATAGFLVLNKLSGGLVGAGVGNVVGGLAGAAIQGAGSRLPGVGRLFAQPVFVVNFPPGFGTGVGGAGVAGKGGGVLGKLGSGLALLSIASDVLAVVGTQQQISQQSTEQGKDIHATLQEMLRNNPNKGALENALAGVERGIHDIESNPLNVLVQGDALAELKSMRDEIRTAITNVNTGKPALPQFGPPVPGKTSRTGGLSPDERGSSRNLEAAIRERALAAGFHPTQAAIQATLNRNIERNTAASLIKQDQIRAAVAAADTRSELAGIRNSIVAQRPPVVTVTTNVSVSATNVVHKYVQVRRSGPTGGSRERSGPLEFG